MYIGDTLPSEFYLLLGLVAALGFIFLVLLLAFIVRFWNMQTAVFNIEAKLGSLIELLERKERSTGQASAETDEAQG